ncbi:uncharacterized protein DMAD_00241 [Drosophila madeirensis]
MSSFNQLGQVVCQLIESVGKPVSYEVVMELMAKMKKRPLTTQERLSVKATLDAGLELGFLQQSRNFYSYCVHPVTRKTEFELEAHQMDASMPPAIETERNQVAASRKGNEGKTADKSTGKSRKLLKRLCSKKKTTAGGLKRLSRKGKTAGKATGGVLKRNASKGKATAGNRKRSCSKGKTTGGDSKRPSRKAKATRGESKCRALDSKRHSRKGKATKK